MPKIMNLNPGRLHLGRDRDGAEICLNQHEQAEIPQSQIDEILGLDKAAGRKPRVMVLETAPVVEVHQDEGAIELTGKWLADRSKIKARLELDEVPGSKEEGLKLLADAGIEVVHAQ